MLLVTVVLKLASSPKAAASSLSVSKVEGAESTRLDTSVSTYCFVAAPNAALGLALRTRLPVIVPPDRIRAPAEVTLAVSVTSALASTPSSLVPSAAISLPSTVPVTVILAKAASSPETIALLAG